MRPGLPGQAVSRSRVKGHVKIGFRGKFPHFSSFTFFTTNSLINSLRTEPFALVLTRKLQRGLLDTQIQTYADYELRVVIQSFRDRAATPAIGTQPEGLFPGKFLWDR